MRGHIESKPNTIQTENVMTETQNGTLRSRRPQLTDSISKLDEMVDGLATAIPGAVADSIREVLGPAFTAALKDAVKEAVAEALKERTSEAAQPMPVPPPVAPTPPATPRPRPDRWKKVKAALAELKTWVGQQLAPVVARAALGWAVVRLVGGATVNSRTASLLTALTAMVAGFTGFVVGPEASAVLLGLATGVITATAVWAAPAARLLVAFRDE